MLSDFYRAITNGLYFVSSQVRKYRAQNNNVPVLAAGATKARKLAQDEEIRSGVEWATSRRAVLILTNEKLVCGSWEIPLTTIKSAQLVRVKSMLAQALILKISAEDGYYQFGLQYDPAWENQTVLKLSIEDGKIQRSLTVRLVRILAFLYLFACCGWFFWATFSHLVLGR